MRHFCGLFVEPLSLRENYKDVLSGGINADRSTMAACPECVPYRKTLQINVGLVVTIFHSPYVSQFNNVILVIKFW